MRLWPSTERPLHTGRDYLSMEQNWSPHHSGNCQYHIFFPVHLQINGGRHSDPLHHTLQRKKWIPVTLAAAKTCTSSNWSPVASFHDEPKCSSTTDEHYHWMNTTSESRKPALTFLGNPGRGEEETKKRRTECWFIFGGPGTNSENNVHLSEFSFVATWKVTTVEKGRTISRPGNNRGNEQ